MNGSHATPTIACAPTAIIRSNPGTPRAKAGTAHSTPPKPANDASRIASIPGGLDRGEEEPVAGRRPKARPAATPAGRTRARAGSIRGAAAGRGGRTSLPTPGSAPRWRRCRATAWVSETSMTPGLGAAGARRRGRAGAWRRRGARGRGRRHPWRRRRDQRRQVGSGGSVGSGGRVGSGMIGVGVAVGRGVGVGRGVAVGGAVGVGGRSGRRGGRRRRSRRRRRTR